jgi:superfamily II DNA or RNA helicase
LNNTLKYINPAILELPKDVEKLPKFSSLSKNLAYEDKRVTFEYLRYKKMQDLDNVWLKAPKNRRHWFIEKNGREHLDNLVTDLAKSRYKNCLFFENGTYKTYSGLRGLVEKTLGLETEKFVTLTPGDWGLIPWSNKPHELRWYQKQAVDLLCPLDGSRRHGAVSIGTGLGKSLVMLYIAKRIGLPAIIVVPTVSIAEQMLADFTKAFGLGKTGQFFGGKKQSGKMFLIAVADSLANVVEGSEDWNNIVNRKLVLVDECHLTPPDSLSRVMFNLLAEIPYRYFFSGTCFRNDGLDTLLRGIVGDTVFEMSVKDGIDGGFLSPLKFYQWKVKSDEKLYPDDALKINKLHLHQNLNVYQHAANLINRAVQEKNRRCLVLVDTVDQFKRLLDGGLLVQAKFAHGPLTATNKSTVPQDQWKLDPTDLVKEFDAGKFPVLVGTACIGCGTDIKSADFIVNIIGLTSEIEISQGVGRGTRLFPGKTNCIYNDYWIYNLPKTMKDGTMSKLDKHASERRRIFNSIYSECQVMG